ncbi:hypothetical protein ANN_02890 [Periplaneta americana]|uniref:Endonuclease/exonuclease/phosphatase domain-containing protein n=1 Tax=Periplaneta americana TaxID=6978 RepID=A0ABQ8TZZ9_PERAM|nr:hypothetical protein ANN_02890 [Periplaneta americana]
MLLLQEVNTENFDFIGPQYDYVVNTGDENRGTAVIYRCGLAVDAIEKHPSGRVISMKVNNIQVLNVYFPSGTNHRQERENFLSKELPFFLRHRYDCLPIGGDWNCVLHAKDQTGQYNPSPVLTNMTQDLQLVDTWELLHGNRVEYTFRRQNGASRLDRFYITRTHSKYIYRIQVFPTPFSDHDCVLLSLQTDIPLPLYGKSFWKMNNTLLYIPEIREQFPQHFEKLTIRANNSKLNILQKWLNIIKPGIKAYFQQAGIIRAAENRETLNFYYQLLNELMMHNRQAVINSLRENFSAVKIVKSLDLTTLQIHLDFMEHNFAIVPKTIKLLEALNQEMPEAPKLIEEMMKLLEGYCDSDVRFELTTSVPQESRPRVSRHRLHGALRDGARRREERERAYAARECARIWCCSARVCVRNCASIRRPEFECSGPQLEGPEFECSGPQLEGPAFEYSELSLKVCGSRYCELE